MDRDFKRVYLLGIGGIGMSALARYFVYEGWVVAGYDRAESEITRSLSELGAEIHYEDSVSIIPEEFLDRDSTVVVFTPAIPKDHSEYRYFIDNGFEVVKRSQMLGHLSKGKYVMAVSGTHGKTSTSTLVSWINRVMTGAGSAFLGGISRNFGSNLVLGGGERLTVEADEFDRSFLTLNPDVAIITSADADHLDIYGTHEAVKEAFSQFVDRIKVGGSLIIKSGVDIELRNSDIDIYRYSYDCECDFYAKNIELLDGGLYRYDLVLPDRVLEGCSLGIPGWINIENSVAAIASVWCGTRAEGVDFDDDKAREALVSFSGVKRRFELYINTPKQVYMDDYAHHPRELLAAITSVKKVFPNREVTAIFQPHLFSRTNDFYKEFAEALSLADRVVLLPIYPARELPMEGVTSDMIAQGVTVPCEIVGLDQLVDVVGAMDTDVVVSFGAGSIDSCCEELARRLQVKM